MRLLRLLWNSLKFSLLYEIKIKKIKISKIKINYIDYKVSILRKSEDSKITISAFPPIVFRRFDCAVGVSFVRI